MPNIHLETSLELPRASLDAFFADLHTYICSHSGIALKSCKSRLFKSNAAWVGDQMFVRDYFF